MRSRASKYQEIIRESAEWSREDLEEEEQEQKSQGHGDDSESVCKINEYKMMKEHVLKILQRKLDKKYYDKIIKSSKRAAKKAKKSWSIGSCYKSLKVA